MYFLNENFNNNILQNFLLKIILKTNVFILMHFQGEMVYFFSSKTKARKGKVLNIRPKIVKHNKLLSHKYTVYQK